MSITSSRRGALGSYACKPRDGGGAEQGRPCGRSDLAVDRERPAVGGGVAGLEVHHCLSGALAEISVGDQGAELQLVEPDLRRAHVGRPDHAPREHAMERRGARRRRINRRATDDRHRNVCGRRRRGEWGLGCSLQRKRTEIADLVIDSVGIYFVIEVAELPLRHQLQQIPSAGGLESSRAAKPVRLRQPRQLHEPAAQQRRARETRAVDATL